MTLSVIICGVTGKTCWELNPWASFKAHLTWWLPAKTLCVWGGKSLQLTLHYCQPQLHSSTQANWWLSNGMSTVKTLNLYPASGQPPEPRHTCIHTSLYTDLLQSSTQTSPKWDEHNNRSPFHSLKTVTATRKPHGGTKRSAEGKKSDIYRTHSRENWGINVQWQKTGLIQRWEGLAVTVSSEIWESSSGGLTQLKLPHTRSAHFIMLHFAFKRKSFWTNAEL